MGDASTTEAAINTTLHPTSTSAEDSILQAPSAGSAVFFFCFFFSTRGSDTSYVIVFHSSCLDASFADASRLTAVVFLGFCLCRQCARARVYTAACAACCRWVANTERIEKLKCTQKPHMRAPANFTRESCRNGKAKAVAALCCFGK